MIKHKLILLNLLFIPFFAFGQSANSAVQEAFRTYKSAILNNDGSLAYSSIDKNTRGAYDNYLSMALTADAEKIETLGILDKMQIIIMRHRIPKAELIKMSGKDLFE